MKIKSVKTSLLGQTVPTNINGVAGRYIEEHMQQEGWQMILNNFKKYIEKNYN